MDRTSAPGYNLVAGIRQWVNKNLLGGVPGTQIDQVFMNDLQEELVHAFIESSYAPGASVVQVPTAGAQNQVKAATDFFYGYKIDPIHNNHTLQIYDRGTIFECNAGCNTFNLPNASGFDPGFIFGVMGNQNTTTISLTTALNDGGALQGVSSFSIGVGDFVVFQAQGVNWGIISASSALMTTHGKAFFGTAASGNWTCPNGVWVIDVTLIGGGAPGGASSSTALSGNFSGAGGGAGAAAKFCAAVVPGTAYAYTVGTAANNSYFLGVTAGAGGAAGAYTGGSTAGGTGGVVSGAATGLIGVMVPIAGGDGSPGMYANTAAFAGNGGNSIWGGGGRAGAGGGAAGQTYGAGGGGAYGSASGPGGAGASGALLIEY